GPLTTCCAWPGVTASPAAGRRRCSASPARIASSPLPGACMPFYRASLPLSRQTLNFAAGIIRRHRISIGSLWRKLHPGQQALLVLVYLRKGETFASLAAGFGVGTATAWRYVEETVALLAARAPRPRKAARDAARAGHAYVVLDGTLIPIDRV